MTTIVRLAAALIAAALIAVAAGCGGGGDGEFSATCSLARSEFGPFSTDAPLGSTLSDSQRQAQKEQSGFDEWIEISADGTWNQAWDIATPILGGGIHTDLTWIDADGEITDLYEAGDSFAFTDLRVSRSFQGKIEHARAPLYIGVDPAQDANFDAPCTVTALMVGDEQNDALLDVLAAARFPADG